MNIPVICHGTYSGYAHYRCRCVPCGQAHQSYMRHRARQQAYGTWRPWGDLDAVRARITTLVERGWTRAAIGRAAGVDGLGVRKIHTGGTRRVRGWVADRILAIEATDVPPAKGYVPADGTVRRLRALAALGYSLQAVAPHCPGASLPALSPVRVGRRRWVRAATAEGVRAAYDSLSMTAPAGGESVRAMAREEGWLPPLAWDDEWLDLSEAALREAMGRHVAAMSDTEVRRCSDAYRVGDRSPLIVAGYEEHLERRKARRREVAA